MRKNGKVVLMIALVWCLSLLLAACGNRQPISKDNAEASTSDSIVSNISVYHVGDKTKSMLQVCEKEIQNISITLTSFSDYEELQKGIEEQGFPDLLLIDDDYSDSQIDLAKWITENRIAVLDEFLSADESYQRDHYLGGVMEACQLHSVQYMLPISARNDFLVQSVMQGEDTLLTALPDDYTLDELLDALLQDADLHTDDSLYWTVMPQNWDIPSIACWTDSFLESTDMLKIDWQTFSYEANKESIKKGLDYLRVCIQGYMRFYSDESGATLGKSGFADLEDMHLTGMNNGNFPYIVRYYMSAYNQLLKEDLKVYTYPSVDDVEKAGATVTCMALIGQESENKEAAYQVARKMMDISADHWSAINLDDPLVNVQSVNKNVLLEEVEMLQKDYGAQFRGLQKVTFDRQPLTDEMAKKLTDWIEKVDYADICNPQVCQSIGEHFKPYILGQSDDFETAYLAFINDLEGIMESYQ